MDAVVLVVGLFVLILLSVRLLSIMLPIGYNLFATAVFSRYMREEQEKEVEARLNEL